MASPRKRRIKRAAALNVLKNEVAAPVPAAEKVVEATEEKAAEPVVEKTEKPAKKISKKKKSLFSKPTEE